MANSIHITGAREHNLKNIDLTIPRDKMVVFTGLSGSGKSSLAFDTIFAEGQRRYVESLSAYARQFLGQMQKPEVDFIEGLSPAVSIDQKSTNRNPRSTVGTVTEIYDYLRLLFARIGIQHCPICGARIESQSVQQMTDRLLDLPEGTRLLILSPVVRDRKGQYQELFADLIKQGFSRVQIDGDISELSESIELDRNLRHTIEVVVDRLVIKPEVQQRLADSIETTLKLSKGLMIAQIVGVPTKSAEGELAVTPENNEETPLIKRNKKTEEKTSLRSAESSTGGFSSSSLLSTSDKNSGFNVESEKNSENRIKFSQTRACPNEHPLALDEIEPRTFSFNAPWGACPDCDGIGYKMEVDRELIVPDPSLSINEGAVEPWTKMNSRIHDSEITSLSDDLGFSLDTPFNKLPKKIQDIILYGKDFRINVSYRNRWGRIREYTSGFEGIIKQMQRRYEQTDPGSWSKQYYEQYMREIKCFTCHGQRLKPEVLAVKVGGKSIAEVCELSVDKCLEFFAKVKLTKTEARIVTEVLKEIRERLQFMLNVGLNYLDLQRPAKTLSGGEAQRIRLATQIGSGLMGVLYVLDEPSIGLHQRDNQKLIATLKELRDKGNTLIVVEHDQETIESSDFLVDIGPLAGDSGGEIVYAGPTKRIKSAKNSLTAQYLTGKKRIETPIRRRKPKGKPIHVVGARENNLKDIDVNFPKGVFTCVTGVSGSGKSSLVNSILHYALANKLNRARLVPGHHRRIENIDDLDKVIHVDQGPIGRSPRSNPATYTGVWDKIRALFAETRDAKERGYKVGRFSFNVHGGRCEGCSGDGTIKIEMNFLPDVYVDCEVCHGKRYNRETLEVKYKGKNVSDILEMPIDKAAEFFHDIPAIARYLNTLVDVGLGYVKMGQMAPTLSGGESQRVKLATELHKRSTGKTVYILDEPTTGLHFEDIKKLLGILQGLVDLGNTVIVIEHNLDVIKSADWIIDLGPEGGDGGGEIVAEGTPEQVAKVKTSYTGEYLKRMFESGE